MQRVLQKQGEKTKLQAHKLLYQGSPSSEQQDEHEVLATDDDVWNQFAMTASQWESRQADGNEKEGWGIVAKGLQKGIQRMVKDIPEDSESWYDHERR